MIRNTDKDFDNPQVSIVICAYNAEKFLAQAIGSVLRQSLVDFEIIVIDDASIDGTAELVKRFANTDSRIKYFCNQINLGVSKSRNRGVSLAKGSYVAMLDSDDYWLDDDKLAKQILYLDSHIETALAGTAIMLVDPEGREIGRDIYAVTDQAIRKSILRKNQFAQSSVLFRKSVFLEVGGYDEDLPVCEDYDLWLKIGRKHQLGNLSDLYTAYLIRPDSLSWARRREVAVYTDRLIEKYRGDYPGYRFAKAKSWLRLIASIYQNNRKDK